MSMFLSTAYFYDARIQHLPDYHREIYIRFCILKGHGTLRVKDPEELVRRLYPEFDFPEEMVMEAVDNLKRVHLIYQKHDPKKDEEVFLIYEPGIYPLDILNPEWRENDAKETQQ